MIRELLIIITAVAGFVLAAYIHHKHKTQQPLVCRIGYDCNKVVTSKYATTFGFKNDMLGMIYYDFVAISYAILLLLPSLRIPLINYGLLAATGGAFLFSVYLVFIQAFIIKEWCEWCLGSALISTIIFLLAVL